MVENAKQESRLKDLIAKGKEQGYLTYAEVNDHLPEDISDPDQIEDIIRMIADMGITVYEKAPDADTLLTDESNSVDEAAAEEAAAALAAVETEAGRTTDPVRMYMREMGTVELLTREGEIVIAKRIEEGLREVMAAMAHFPGSVDSIIAEYERIVEEEGRLSDLYINWIDPNDNEPAVITPKGQETQKDESDDDDEEEVDTGPDPEEARERFGELKKLSNAVTKAIEKHGRDSKQAGKALEILAQEFVPLKLVPRHFENLVSTVRYTLSRIRAQEKEIMTQCVRNAGIPRKSFIKDFPGNETSNDWLEQQLKNKDYGKSLEPFKNLQDILKRYQERPAYKSAIKKGGDYSLGK